MLYIFLGVIYAHSDVITPKKFYNSGHRCFIGFLTHIRLGWEYILRENILDNFWEASMYNEKKIYGIDTWAQCYKTFLSVNY